jgi:outer membrane protein OmpA-like peptidoglycan-associated protein
MRRAAVLLIAVTFLAGAAAGEQKDVTGCKDHALFTRMPTYWIHGCSEKGFDAFAFPVGKGKSERVEGRVWKLTYYPQADAKSKPSELEILRNFESAAAKLGGTVVATDKSRETLRLVKDGKELWIEVWAEFTGKYGLTIVEESGMAQEIVANADAFAGDIRSTGHAAVYGIHFDTGRADIKPESAQAIGEIARLLAGDPGLKLFVVGHTDAQGTVDGNLKLSQARAEAVLQALVATHGAAPARLRAFGCGQFAPVASNETDEGRAKNRRVELVKQ